MLLHDQRRGARSRGWSATSAGTMRVATGLGRRVPHLVSNERGVVAPGEDDARD
jgi:hypothetical protein